MKTILRSLLLTLCLIVCAQFSLQAIPAMPGAFKYTQPDGTVILLERHGDEFFSWTTLAGTNQVVALDADGFYRNSTLDTSAMDEGRHLRQNANGRRRPRGTHNDNLMTHGERHIPVMLANFADVKFQISDPASMFNALLNQKGYSYNGGTGSVQDFYVENSKGVFTPIFDVYGPVTLSGNMGDYGYNEGNEHSARAHEAVAETARLLDNVIDFSKYDYDNDGAVDMMLFYYAGYNEAEGGPEDSIWPHQSSLGGNIILDGKKLGTYFCTSELRGNEGVTMCPIGTTCHEFGHSLGLPDFYDTDYDKHGKSGGLYWFSLMCSGSYNNNGRTPPYFNAEERMILGWMSKSDIPELEEGTISFGSVKDDIAYCTQTDTEGEYFIYECRDGSGWDSFIPEGLLVYHVDKSTVRKVGGLTPFDQWNQWELYNTINAYGDHPCFYVVCAADQLNLNYSGADVNKVFPGGYNITSFKPVDWESNETGDVLSDISYSDGKVSFTHNLIVQRKIIGTVYGQDDAPVPGVYVVVTPVAANSPKLLKASPSDKSFEAITDSEGRFSIGLDGFEGESAHVSFTKSDYEPAGMDVTLSFRSTRVNAVIKKKGEGDVIEYRYYDPSSARSVYGPGPNVENPNSYMSAIRIPAGDLPANGGRLAKVSFPTLWTAKAYYVVVDSGEERLLFSEIPELGPNAEMGNMIDVNLNSLDINIKADKDLYVGIAVEEANPYSGYEGFLFYITKDAHNCYGSPFNRTASNWHSTNFAMVLSATVIPITDVPDPEEWTLALMGFNSIADPGQGDYTSGHAFALDVNLAQDNQIQGEISWTMDGVAIAAGAKSVTLTPGKHTIGASYKLTDGTEESLELIVNVK